MARSHWRLLLVALAILAGLPVGALADVNVAWSTNAVVVDKLGNIWPETNNPCLPWSPETVNTNCDVIRLGASSGSLTVAGSTQAVINPLTFEVGQTGSLDAIPDGYTNEYWLKRNLTVNGITKEIVQPFTHVVTWNWDSLQMGEGNAVVFGDVVVTPLGWSRAYPNGGGSSDGSSNPPLPGLSVQFAEAPEPSTFVLVAGLLTPFLALRRRRAR